MSFSVEEIKRIKESMLKTSYLITKMKKYSQEHTPEAQKRLSLAASTSDVFPLPNGRIGNPIALALEINDYSSALFLIKSAEELGLDTDEVSIDPNSNDFWNAKEEYMFSLKTRELISDEELDSYRKLGGPGFVKRVLKQQRWQLNACQSIEALLNITPEEKKEFYDSLGLNSNGISK